ncbi:hypothetical protein D3C72_1846380 [compost metagenome]
MSAARMGVRDTPSFSTMASSAMRAPPASSPARIISRRRSCALTDCEAPASDASPGVESAWVGSVSMGRMYTRNQDNTRSPI